ncbi:hypothetical protein WJX81_006838 [Elliptochloris bilobata]|uniref:Enoyl reductase (ER) domain-containing protein n=1 Tax=Elliptochloris bilobata TaxID=381761 RepID=A0AAW1SHS3_9CHLO
MAGQIAVTVKSPSETKGELKVYIVTDHPIPSPGDGEVLVQVYLRPVNPSDVMCIAGHYEGFKPKSFPAVPGLEGVGRVVKNGPGATRFPEGTRVVGVPWPAEGGNGTWQQYVNVPEGHLLPVADAVSDEAAAQFLVNPVTAYGFLEVLQVPKGNWLLQTAAGSTLGRQLIALAKHRDVRTINLVRRKAQVQELLDIGADVVISTDEVDDVPARIEEVTGGKLAYAAVDAVAGETTATVAASVRDHGTVLVYGALADFKLELGVADLLFRDVRIHGFWLNHWLAELGDKAPAVLSTLMDLLGNGVIKPHSGKKFPLEQANEAVKANEEPGRSSEGKFFLEG